MRQVPITAREFDLYAWPALGYQSVDNGGEIDAHVRLLKKFKDVSTPTNETTEGVSPRKLDKDSHTFVLEEDEWGRLKKVITSWISKIAGGVMDEYKVLQDKINGAEQEEA